MRKIFVGVAAFALAIISTGRLAVDDAAATIFVTIFVFVVQSPKRTDTNQLTLHATAAITIDTAL